MKQFLATRIQNARDNSSGNNSIEIADLKSSIKL